MRGLIAVALAVMLAGCGDRDTDVDFGADDLGPELAAVLSQDGNVKMGLTDRYVYFALSDSARAEAQAELDEDAGEGGIRGFFGGLMRGVVGKALSFRAKYDVAEIRDIRWEDDRMHFVFTDPDRRLEDNLQVGENQSITDAFGEDAVREFGAVFRALKEDGSGGVDR